MRTDGQTDFAKLKVAFPNFAKALKKKSDASPRGKRKPAG